MSHEILYTSAKSGLRSGSTGFCTVRSTSGLPRNLATALEQLTGYSHAVDPYNAELSDQHPINFAHYTLRLGSQRFQVLGRIANAPLDHTNRSNKLAQLIAFDSSELNISSGEGPAAELLQFEQQQRWVSAWNPDHPPQLLPDSARVALPTTTIQPPSACETWKRAVGHAGWAGVLADTSRGRGSFVPVIFSADQAPLCLLLVQEALGLLTPADRWETTFSTYFSANLPTRVECRWRFLLETSDLARKARRDPRLNAMDLPAIRSAGEAPPVSELTEAACGSTRPWLAEGRIVSAAVPAAPSASFEAVDPRQHDGAAADSIWDTEQEFATAESDPSVVPGTTASRSRSLLNPLAVIPVLLLGVAGIIAFWFFGNPEENAFENIVQQSDQRLGEFNANSVAKVSPVDVEPTESSDSAENDTTSAIEDNPPTVSVDTTNVSELTPEPVVPQPVEPAVSPLEGIREVGNVLPLPDLREHRGWSPLAKLQCDDPERLTLEITGDKAVMKTTMLETEFGPLTDDSRSSDSSSIADIGWKVVRRNTSSTRRKDTVGYFRLHDDALEFRWETSNKTTELRNCALVFRTPDGESETCTLRSVESARPVSLDFKLGRSENDPPRLLADNELMHTDNINVELTFVNLPPRSQPGTTRALRVGDVLRIPIYEEGASADAPPVVETQLIVEATTRFGVRLTQTSFLKWTDLTVFPDPLSTGVSSRSSQEREILSAARLKQVQDRYGDGLTNAEKALGDLRKYIRRLELEKEKIDPENESAREKVQVLINRGRKWEQEYLAIRDQCKDFPDRVRRLTTMLSQLETNVEVHFAVSLDSPGLLKPVPLVSSH